MGFSVPVFRAGNLAILHVKQLNEQCYSKRIQMKTFSLVYLAFHDHVNVLSQHSKEVNISS